MLSTARPIGAGESDPQGEARQGQKSALSVLLHLKLQGLPRISLIFLNPG
jgi:hypothetical protein